MRKKLPNGQKRNNQIGVKVLPLTREKLNFIADRDKITLSTLINQILVEYIDNYLKIAKIEWDKLTPEEKGEGNQQ